MKLTFDSSRFAKAVKQKRVIDDDVDMRFLAKKLKVAVSTISRCENGKKPELITYAKICLWLGTDMSSFFNKSTK